MQFWALFLFVFQMGDKAVGTTWTLTMHLIQELLVNSQCSVGSKSFAKETRVLKMRRVVAGCRKLTMTSWEDHQSWSSHNYTRSCWRTQHRPFCGCLTFEANWKWEKGQKVGASWADWKSKKIVILKCHLLFCAITMNHFPIWLWRVTKSVFYITICNDQLSGCTEKKLQSTSQIWPSFHQKNIMIAVWWSAARLIHYGFLNPGKTVSSEKYAQQMDEMHSRLQHLQPALGSRAGSVLHNNAWLHVTQPTL